MERRCLPFCRQAISKIEVLTSRQPIPIQTPSKSGKAMRVHNVSYFQGSWQLCKISYILIFGCLTDLCSLPPRGQATAKTAHRLLVIQRAQPRIHRVCGPRCSLCLVSIPPTPGELPLCSYPRPRFLAAKLYLAPPNIWLRLRLLIVFALFLATCTLLLHAAFNAPFFTNSPLVLLFSFPCPPPPKLSPPFPPVSFSSSTFDRSPK